MQIAIHCAELLVPCDSPGNALWGQCVDDDPAEVGKRHGCSDPFGVCWIAGNEWCFSAHAPSVGRGAT